MEKVKLTPEQKEKVEKVIDKEFDNGNLHKIGGSDDFAYLVISQDTPPWWVSYNLLGTYYNGPKEILGAILGEEKKEIKNG
jgi:hypothetical protein